MGTPNKPDKRALAVSLRIRGFSVREIADELHVSKSSVSLWVRGLRENNKQEYETIYCKKCGKPIPKSIIIDGKRHRVNNKANRCYCLECSPFYARDSPRPISRSSSATTKTCTSCGRNLPIDSFHSCGKGMKRGDCKECYNSKITNLRDKRKVKAIRYLGGRCKLCGYDKNWSALEFHHRESETKEMIISKLLCARTESVKSKLVAELDKCDLLCAICHRELHNPLCLMEE